MAAISTRMHHPRPAFRRGGTPSTSFLRFASPPPILLQSRATAIRPLAHASARRNDDDDALTYPVALALSGGSCGGCDDSSYSSSSSSSSSDDSTTDFIYGSDDSSAEPEKKEANTTHESVGTAVAPPVPPSDMWLWGGIAVWFAAMVLSAKNGWLSSETTSVTVVKLQVAVRGKEMVKSAQKDLNAIAESVQASNQRWYKFILTGLVVIFMPAVPYFVWSILMNRLFFAETMYILRRNQYFCTSSSLSVVAAEESSWKWHFDIISSHERSKFDEETLSNWNGFKRKETYSMKTDGSKNEYIVVTILIATNGTMNLPKVIRSAAELDTLAAFLNSRPESGLRGVRVLWTPQDADDVLSEERMRKDYPNLKPLAW
nr:uncharacterized protein LOC127315613 [Lolium perenne]